MSAGSTLASLLTAVKANAAAVAVAGAVVVGGGAAAVAVTTGAVHLPGQRTEATHTPDATAGAAARQQACTNHNGDADNLAQTYSQNKLFSSEAAAKKEICTLFVGTNGRAFGFGEVQQMLNLAAAIKSNAASSATSKSCALTYAGGGDADVDALLNTIMHDVANGTPLEQLASNCGASTHGQGSGQGGGQPSGTPGVKPSGTPGEKPTGTPGKP